MIKKSLCPILIKLLQIPSIEIAVWHAPFLEAQEGHGAEAKDTDALIAFITKPEVEKKNVQRVILKAGKMDENGTAKFMENLGCVDDELDY